jgi:hypothetical protein
MRPTCAYCGAPEGELHLPLCASIVAAAEALPKPTAELVIHPSARVTPSMVLDRMRHRLDKGEMKAILVAYLTPDGETRTMWSEMTKAETCFLHMMQGGDYLRRPQR